MPGDVPAAESLVLPSSPHPLPLLSHPSNRCKSTKNDKPRLSQEISEHNLSPAAKARERKLKEDSLAIVLGPFHVECRRCGACVKLSAKSVYDTFHWKTHKERCLRRMKKTNPSNSDSQPPLVTDSTPQNLHERKVRQNQSQIVQKASTSAASSPSSQSSRAVLPVLESPIPRNKVSSPSTPRQESRNTSKMTGRSSTTAMDTESEFRELREHDQQGYEGRSDAVTPTPDQYRHIPDSLNGRPESSMTPNQAKQEFYPARWQDWNWSYLVPRV